MPASAVEKPDWDHIDTVLLDLDGTLLDLVYDNHFWLEIVPEAYAAARMTTVDVARTELAPRFRACEGTLPWYCIEHWSRELGLDIVQSFGIGIIGHLDDQLTAPGLRAPFRHVEAARHRISPPRVAP